MCVYMPYTYIYNRQKFVSNILPFLGISVVDGLGLVLGGADTATKQFSTFKNRIYVDVAYFARN